MSSRVFKTNTEMHWINSCRGPWKAEHPEQRQADRCGVSTAICVLEDDGHGFHQEKNGAINNFGFYNKNDGLHRVQPSNSLIFASKSWGSTVKIVSKIPVGGGLL